MAGSEFNFLVCQELEFTALAWHLDSQRIEQMKRIAGHAEALT